jgi:hypothetical protein
MAEASDEAGAAVFGEGSGLALAGAEALGGEPFIRHGMPATGRRTALCMAIPMG